MANRNYIQFFESDSEGSNNGQITINNRSPKVLKTRTNYYETLQDQEFFKRFRLTKPTVYLLLGLICDELHHKTHRNNVVSLMNELLLTLPFYNLGSMLIVKVDKILHSKTHTWYAFKLMGIEGKPVLLTAMQISEGLKNSFRSLASAPRVKVELFDQFTWVMIIQKKLKGSGADTVHMFTFVYTPGEHYIFASEKNVKEDISKGLLSTFGYRILSDCNLSASDIPSMIILLRNKAGKAFDAHSVQHTVAPYVPGPGVVTENGMDYTDQRLKKKYTNTIFGEDCPVLKNFIVKEMGQKVKNKKTCRTSLMIRSTNILEFLKILFVRGVLVIPVPPFIERIRILGKNDIQIRPVSGNSTQSEQQN